MEKIDLKKQLKHLYAPSAKSVQLVDVPEMQFAMVDGQLGLGETPATSQTFQEAMRALYGLTYTLKFMSKLHEVDPIDYTVMALEGLWWSESGGFDMSRPETWIWTVMMMQPDHVTMEMYQAALRQVKEKRDSPALDRARFERFHEGLSVQIMHIGPYAEEPQTIERLHVYARENGYALRGKHHEIYLGDPRRTKPERLKTVLRQPVEKIS